MLEYIILFYNYFKLFMGLSVFTFIFKFCFDTCNEKINLKGKNGKKKQTIKSRIGLALAYLFFCTILYFSLTPRVFFTIISLIGIGTLYALDKFDKATVNQLCVHDKNKLVRFLWKILYTIINIVLLIYSPIHKIMLNNFSNLFTNAKNKTKSKVNQHMFGGIGGGLSGLSGLAGLGDITTMVGNKGIDLGHNLKKVIHELTSDNNDDKTTSSMDDYINKTDKERSKYIIGENQKAIIEETSTEIKNEITTDEIIKDFKQEIKPIQLNKNEVNDFKKYEQILNSEMSVQDNNGIDQEENNDEVCQVENENINKKEESEKLLKLFKKMNDIFSSTEEPSTIEDNVNGSEVNA